MCAPFDSGVAFFFAGLTAWIGAAGLRRARSAIVDQRGFTLTEGLTYLSIVILAFLLAYFVITTRCYRTAVPLDVVPIALRVGAIQTGAPAPAGTRAPACETGGYCTSPGKSCVSDKKCVDTYDWDTSATSWRCGCECR